MRRLGPCRTHPLPCRPEGFPQGRFVLSRPGGRGRLQRAEAGEASGKRLGEVPGKVLEKLPGKNRAQRFRPPFSKGGGAGGTDPCCVLRNAAQRHIIRKHRAGGQRPDGAPGIPGGCAVRGPQRALSRGKAAASSAARAVSGRPGAGSTLQGARRESSRRMHPAGCKGLKPERRGNPAPAPSFPSKKR